MHVKLIPALFLSACVGMSVVPVDSGQADAEDTGPELAGFGGVTFPDELDLGEVELGELVQADLVLSNDSDTNVTMTEVNVDLSTAWTAEHSSVPWVVGSGGSYVISLTFLPTAEGEETGTITFGLDGVDGLGSITVSGTGVRDGGGPGDGGSTGDGGATGDGGGGDGGGDGGGGGGAGITLSPSTVSFPVTTIGTSASDSLIVRNTTPDSIEIAELNVSNTTIFGTSGLTAPYTMSAGEVIELQVSFTPAEAIAYAGTVTLVGRTGDYVVSLNGTGQVAPLGYGILTVDTGDKTDDEMSFSSISGVPDSQTVTLGNDGDEPLVVSEVYVNNDSTFGEYSVSWSSKAVINPGATQTFTVSYTCPDVICLDVADTGDDTNIVHIISDDPTTPDWTIDLSGS